MSGGPLPEPAWGPLVAVYFVLIGVPSGITLASWWLRRSRGPVADAIEREASWVALGSLVAVGGILIVDLGRPERFYLMLTRFDNLGSPIAVGAKLIALKSFLLAVALYAMERDRRRGRPSREAAEERVAGKVNAAMPVLLAAVSFGLAIYPASVLSRSWASPLAGSSGSALLHLLTALLMGVAVAVLIACAAGGPGSAGAPSEILRFGRGALASLLALFGLTLAFEGLSLHGDPPDRLVLHELLTGSLAAVFWGLVVVVGMAVPAVGLSVAAARRATFAVSAAAVLTGAAATRYLIFAAGQAAGQ